MLEQNVVYCEVNKITGEVIFYPTDEQVYLMRRQLMKYCDKMRCAKCPIYKEHPGESCIYHTTRNRLTRNYLIAFKNFDKLKVELKTNYEKMKEIQSHYGRDVQIDKCAEECGELIQALMKIRNVDEDDPAYEMKLDNLLEELADVQITVSEICLSLGEEEIISEKISVLIDYKLNRQIRRIRNEEEG